MSELAEAREWHRIILTSVRECLETWQLQSHAESGADDAGGVCGGDGGRSWCAEGREARRWYGLIRRQRT